MLDAPEDIRGKYKSIDTNVTGLKIGELLPKMAKTMDKVCLVRSERLVRRDLKASQAPPSVVRPVRKGRLVLWDLPGLTGTTVKPDLSEHKAIQVLRDR